MLYGVLALFSTLFVSNTKAEDVKRILIDPVIANDTKYTDILTEDFMYPAWDITEKKPLFFSGSAVRAETIAKSDLNSVYSMDYN